MQNISDSLSMPFEVISLAFPTSLAFKRFPSTRKADFAFQEVSVTLPVLFFP